MNSLKIPKLVAHRGYAKLYPENSLLAIDAAFEAGACMVEIDVQCSMDGLPFIYHDENMQRLSNCNDNITDKHSDELSSMFAGEPQRLGDKYSNTPISPLSDIVTILKKYPDRKLLVELKQESLSHFGNTNMVDKVLEVLFSVSNQIIMISYNEKALDYAKQKCHRTIAWVVTKWNQQSYEIAKKLQPEYIICNYKKIDFDNEGLWPGAWSWVMYEVTDPQLALDLCVKGIEYIETMDIVGMLENESLKKASCE